MTLSHGVFLVDAIAQQVLGWMVAESFYAAIVFTVVLLASWVVRGRGSHIQMALWSMVLIRLVLPVDLSHPLSAGQLIAAMGSISLNEHAEIHESTAIWGEQPPLASFDVEPRTATVFPWALFGVMAWASGAILCGRRIWEVRRRFAEVCAGANACQDHTLQQRLLWWRRQFGVRRSVRLVVTERSVSPFTMGLVRPSVVLPAGLLGQTSVCDAAIAHEMAHIKRLDAFWVSLQQVLHVVYFFHPLVWLAGSKIDFERERRCDAMVLAIGIVSPRRYAAALLDAAGLHLGLEPAMGLTTPKRRITMRIESALNFRRTSLVTRIGSLACVIVLAAVLLPLESRADVREVAPQSEAVAPVAPSAPAAPAVPGRQASIPEAPPSPKSEPAPPEIPAPDAEIDLKNPVPPAKVALGWGPAFHPFEKREFIHRGIDLAAPEGTPVAAAADGVVGSVLVDDGGLATGRYVVLNHADGFSTYYGHLGEIGVVEGQSVAQGETIASIGMTGLTTGPHVHFELRLHGEAVEPKGLLGG